MYRFAPLLLLAIATIASAAPPPAPPQFVATSVADGLPSSTIYKIAQDRDGFIWLGTADGLARYDGVSFRVFRSDPAKPESLSNNNVTALLIDRQGRIWCGGEGSGLNRLDVETERFEHWRHVPNDAKTLGDDDVWTLAEDADGALWVGTYLGGLNRLQPDGSFAHVDHDPENPASLRSSLGTSKMPP